MPDERCADPQDEIVVLQATATLFTNSAFCKELSVTSLGNTVLSA